MDTPEAHWEAMEEALRAEIAALREECDELNHLFDVQHTRMGLATTAWREAHPGNELVVLPDLGAVLEWLLAERDRLRATLADVDTCDRDGEEVRRALTGEIDRLRAVLADLEKQCDCCHGRGVYSTDCSLCGDSTCDHYCDSKELPCPRPVHAAIRALKGEP